MMRPARARRLHHPMSEAQPRRLLVVANLTESTPQLLKEVERRAKAGCTVTLIVPPERHPDAPDWSPEDAQGPGAARRARPPGAGRRRRRRRGGDDRRPRRTDGACDEILLCTPPEHHPHWHRHSLPAQIQKLGIPVTVIPPDASGWSYEHGFPDDWVRTEVGPLT